MPGKVHSPQPPCEGHPRHVGTVSRFYAVQDRCAGSASIGSGVEKEVAAPGRARGATKGS